MRRTKVSTLDADSTRQINLNKLKLSSSNVFVSIVALLHTFVYTV